MAYTALLTAYQSTYLNEGLKTNKIGYHQLLATAVPYAHHAMQRHMLVHVSTLRALASDVHWTYAWLKTWGRAMASSIAINCPISRHGMTHYNQYLKGFNEHLKIKHGGV